jgi:hypothetical protein
MRRFLTLRPKRYDYVPRGLNGLQSVGILLAQLLDFATTVVGLRLGAIEQNGPMAKLIETYGVDTFLTIKVVAAAILIWFAWRRPNAAWSVSLVYYAVALWNLSVIYRLLDIVTITFP